MKHSLLSATAIVAMLASCTSEVIPERPVEVVKAPIAFSGAPGLMTRSTTEGAAAAALLGNEFVVYGSKEGGAERDNGMIMPGYVVEYINGTWEYSHKTGQPIKFWDTSATSYSFAAYSNQNRDANNPKFQDPQITGPSAMTAPFEIPSVTAAQLGKIYFAPSKTIQPAAYSQDVKFTFSNAAAKIRVAFYNTIPGYDVRIIGFYESASANEYNNNVVFYGAADRFIDKAGYDVAPSSDAIAYTQKNPTTTSKITLGGDITSDAIGGPNITNATFDQDDNAWTFVHPQPENDKPLMLKVRYRMWAEGDVHAPEDHEVTIPAAYAKWQPNHAYTYFFKITDSDLQPIVFNAVVDDFHNEETITTVDPSNNIDITTYKASSNVQGNDQYLKGDVITVAITAPTTLSFTKDFGHIAVADFDAATHITESNCAKLVTTWTPLDDKITLSEQGYYVIRVSWTEGTETKCAYKVITVRTPQANPDPEPEPEPGE